jgi:hypothetical protein
VIVSHERALDLAVEGLDFDLEPVQVRQLDEHLAACEECAAKAEALRADDAELHEIDWDASSGSPLGPGPDPLPDAPDEWAQPPVDLNDLDEDGEGDEGDEGSEPQGDAEGHRDATESDEGREADAGDDRASSAGSEGESGDEERPDDEPDGDDPSDTFGGSDPDSLSDEELNDLPVPMPDNTLPTCAADGVEDAAARNGARHGDHLNKEAETDVRHSETIESVDGSRKYRVEVCTTLKGIKQYKYNQRPKPSATAAAAIRNTILQSRTGHTGISRHQARGRLDNKSLFRIAMSDPRLFHRRHAPSPGKYLVWIMVDCSSSMAGREICDAAEVAHALADASTGTPTVRMAVWGWSTPFLREHESLAEAGVARVWQSGMPPADVFRITTLPMGVTPDRAVMGWSWRAIRRECRTDERPIIVMCSDGWGDRDLPVEIEAARKHGVDVRSVAFGNLDEGRQLQRYGKGNYVPWAGSILATSRPLAQMIGKLVSTK